MTGCSSGKVGHTSESAARRAAVAVAQRRTGDRPRVYACPTCHRWHLTTAPGQRRAMARRRHARMIEPHPASRAELDAWFAEHSRPGGQVLSAVSPMSDA